LNILGIGTDIVEIERITSIWQKYGLRFAKHILAVDELQELEKSKYPARFLAKRFAAKEAVAKALGTGFCNNVYFTQIRVIKDSLGKPEVVFLLNTKQYIDSLGKVTCHLSISDEIHYAIAFVILQSVRASGAARPFP
jgi:holo-[acyl-carrier protein] synthase